jgi:hypothetical protein
MCDGNADDAAWSQGSDSLYLDIMTQLYGEEPSTGCFVINATSREMTIQTLQYTDGTEQNDNDLNFFGGKAKAEAKVNGNQITLTRVN